MKKILILLPFLLLYATCYADDMRFEEIHIPIAREFTITTSEYSLNINEDNVSKMNKEQLQGLVLIMQFSDWLESTKNMFMSKDDWRDLAYIYNAIIKQYNLAVKEVYEEERNS